LIEALIALSIVAIALSSIGALIAVTVRGTSAIEGKLHRLGVANAVMQSLPDRNQLAIGPLTAESAGHRWRIGIAPFVTNTPLPPSEWVPRSILVTVESQSAGAIEISTVRLLRRSGG
jgi:hypothetical protein